MIFQFCTILLHTLFLKMEGLKKAAKYFQSAVTVCKLFHVINPHVCMWKHILTHLACASNARARQWRIFTELYSHITPIELVKLILKCCSYLMIAAVIMPEPVPGKNNSREEAKDEVWTDAGLLRAAAKYKEKRDFGGVDAEVWEKIKRQKAAEIIHGCFTKKTLWQCGYVSRDAIPLGLARRTSSVPLPLSFFCTSRRALCRRLPARPS
jgi:hypothetical protein